MFGSGVGIGTTKISIEWRNRQERTLLIDGRLALGVNGAAVGSGRPTCAEVLIDVGERQTPEVVVWDFDASVVPMAFQKQHECPRTLLY
jgi:hypothetical protein